MARVNQSYSTFHRKELKRLLYLQRSLLALAILTSVEGLAGVFLLFRDGMIVQSSIPLICLTGTALTLFFFYRTENFARAINVQISIAFVLPFFLQFFFGGIVASGLMMIWSFLGLAATLILVSRSKRWHWLLFYVGLITLSIFAEWGGFFQTPQFVTPEFSMGMLAFNLIVIVPVAYALVKNKLESDVDLFRHIRNTNMKLSETLSELSRHKRLLDQAQKISQIAHFELDLVGGQEFWSDEIYTIVDLRPRVDKVSFKAYLGCLHEDDRQYRLSYPMHVHEPLKDFRFTLRTVDRNGRIRHIEENGVVIKDANGKNVRIRGTIQDVTEEKQIEDTLIRAVRLAEEANQAKTQFLSNINHEIRTPLNSIVGLSKLLNTKIYDKQLAQYTERISTAADQLLKLLNDVLAFSNAQAGQLRPEMGYFQMRSLIEEVNRMVSVVNQNKLYFVVDNKTSVEYVFNDYKKLQHTLMCLLSNAFKFTQKGSVILLIEPEGEEKISFSVMDTGVGISDEQLQVIFEAFRQVEQGTDRSYGGSGLGLSLARELADTMNGTLRVKSKLGLGSSFSVTIPYREQVSL